MAPCFPEEIVSNAAVLLFGGIETTEGMIANSLTRTGSSCGGARNAATSRSPTARTFVWACTWPGSRRA